MLTVSTFCYLTTLRCLLSQLPSLCRSEFVVLSLFISVELSRCLFCFSLVSDILPWGISHSFTGFLTFVSLGDIRGRGHVKEPSWDNLSIYPDSLFLKKIFSPSLSLLASTVPVFFPSKNKQNPIQSIKSRSGATEDEMVG